MYQQPPGARASVATTSQQNRDTFLPYLDSLPSIAAAAHRESRRVSGANAPVDNSDDKKNKEEAAADARSSKVLGAASPRLTVGPFDSPSLAHLNSSTEAKESVEGSPVVDRGAIRSSSPYNSPDIAITVPGSTAFNDESEKESLVALASSSNVSLTPATAKAAATNRYSKVLHGLGLFGATSRRKSNTAAMKSSPNTKG